MTRGNDKPVDVEAVMRRAVDALENNGSRRIARELGEAYAVIESVLVTGRELYSAVNVPAPHPLDSTADRVFTAANARFYAALARATGAES